MRSLQEWLLASGAGISILGLGLGFYAESPGSAYYPALYAERFCGWCLMAGLLLALLGALIWGTRTTITNCFLGAVGTALVGCLTALFGQINIHGATGGLLYVVFAAAIATVFLAIIAVLRFLLRRRRLASRNL